MSIFAKVDGQLKNVKNSKKKLERHLKWLKKNSALLEGPKWWVPDDEVPEPLYLVLETRLTNSPGPGVYSYLLRRCARENALPELKRVHQHLVSSRHASNTFVLNFLIHAYGRLGCLDDARQVFESMKKRNVYTFSTMITAYNHVAHFADAHDVYQLMDMDGVKPDMHLLSSMLGACTRPEDLPEGKQIHARILDMKCDWNSSVQNALATMYAKCGCPDRAKEIFQSITSKDVVAWTAVISSYAHNGCYKQALDVYLGMEVEPNDVTYSVMLKVCSNLGVLEDAKAVHKRMIDSRLVEMNMVIETSLVNMYANCRSLDDAKQVFDKMKERNLVAWTSMISAYAQQGNAKEAFDLFWKMNSEGVEADGVVYACVLDACSSPADLAEGRKIHEKFNSSRLKSQSLVQNSLINMYSKCCSISDARKVFDEMLQRDSISWSTMITGYTQNGQAHQAIDLFKKMCSEDAPGNAVSYASLLAACSVIGADALDIGKEIHDKIITVGVQSDVLIDNALVNMYAKCGSIDDARKHFDGMVVRNDVTWTVMISAYVRKGYGNEGLSVYGRMISEGVQPNNVTYGSVISACSIVGDVEEGKRVHSEVMMKGFECDIIVATSLVNMYVKYNELDKAREIFDKNKMKSNSVSMWVSMILAYAQYGNCKESIQLFQRMECEGIVVDDSNKRLLLACKPHNEAFQLMLCEYDGEILPDISSAAADD